MSKVSTKEQQRFVIVYTGAVNIHVLQLEVIEKIPDQ